ncbi:hypothetical protein RHMOL_Rhmol08G0160200 [Rhododendron molle]|uniref:Uncharacterized protein n=1 Tax=Rhododendron molle TaxID=49168 RepID=A0ACC0MP53_RHOML|nr:hypothetical protein RHMOL_Rhmol08G0160200 [Rhododendron molle]
MQWLPNYMCRTLILCVRIIKMIFHVWIARLMKRMTKWTFKIISCISLLIIIRRTSFYCMPSAITYRACTIMNLIEEIHASGQNKKNSTTK